MCDLDKITCTYPYIQYEIGRDIMQGNLGIGKCVGSFVFQVTN